MGRNIRSSPDLKVDICRLDLSTSDSFGLKPMLEDLSIKHKIQTRTVYEASIEVVVPRDENHQFWSRRDLNDCKNCDDGIPINVKAFGSSVRDAKQNAMLRLKAFLDDCHEQIRPSSRLPLKNFSKYPDFNFKDDAVVQVAKELLEIYRRVKSFITLPEEENAAWEEVSGMLERLLEEKTDSNLGPLLKYYLV